MDWFHIGKKFQPLLNSLAQADRESLENAKWKLWHGQETEALEKLKILRNQIQNQKQKSQLKALEAYLQSNQEYLINYEQRAQSKQTSTS